MKKVVSMMLLAVMCIGLLAGSAHADGLSDFVGYWEVQNVALGGYTVGANYLGFEMTAVVHSDGIFILIMDADMVADYINGYGGNYYLGEGADRIDLSFDNQGRMHVSWLLEDSTKLDIRMRKGKAEKVSARLSDYVGEWKLTAADTEEYGDFSMTVYNDGFAMLIAEDGILPLRLGTQGRAGPASWIMKG